ncbi:MAG: ABC transporter ATP-binding protein [Desulfarculaceae bacterium]|nr:ABC transporter ATP-binding protein [Desulfarculaceae bacterium]MCF8047000.1 ABC transporter ATP-binding protein [Desulfarculaceae bacterium]MCF8063621.1 ABC transporter ATP-binding protein [Desulfarculaceae bacterium]MCF8097701.1 ABC transporter ATP-binding protein [Desulfarculaceae bacterium]
MLLELTDVHTYYALSHILFGISFGVEEGSLVCVLGRNGAGKTTTMRSIIGLTKPSKGAVMFKGKDIAGLAPYQIAQRGVGFVPEDRLMFHDLTVKENLEIGARVLNKKPKVKVLWDLDRVWDAFPKLEQLKHRKSGYLSGGEQQMLTIARTLMGNPDLLLLDEPCEGLAPLIVKMLGELIVKISKTGTTILLAEQNIKFALDIAEKGFIIEKGVIMYHGTAQELMDDEEVRNKFLGVGISRKGD